MAAKVGENGGKSTKYLVLSTKTEAFLSGDHLASVLLRQVERTKFEETSFEIQANPKRLCFPFDQRVSYKGFCLCTLYSGE